MIDTSVMEKIGEGGEIVAYKSDNKVARRYKIENFDKKPDYNEHKETDFADFSRYYN